MLSYLSGGDAVKRIRVHHVATCYGVHDVRDPCPAVTQEGMGFNVLKWPQLKIIFHIVSKTQSTKNMYNENK
jgi:hypothetical protein